MKERRTFLRFPLRTKMKKGWILILFLVVLIGCHKSKLPEPTDSFYVNDYADALMPYTEREIVGYNRYLYEVYGEIQIVYATFLVETPEEMESIDKTELFRHWKIGKNDMGLLVLLYFQKEMIENIESRTLVGYAFEVGYRLEPLYTPIVLSDIADQTLLNPNHYDIADLMVMHLNYELLNLAYESLYNESPISYDMDDYFEELMNAPYVPDNDLWDFLWIISLLDQGFWGYVILGGFVLLGGSFGIMKIKGGGGSSGGAGIYKRRR